MDQVRTSKLLSRVLRHQPGSIGIELDDAGWVDVETLLVALARHGQPLTRRDLSDVVRDSDKQRFALDDAADRIRANQGHSVEVALGLQPAVPPPVLYHGTPVRNVEAILRDGLKKGSRHAVHLSSDIVTARRVGARRGAHLVLVVDSGAMQAKGHPFTVSANGVWLTEAVPAAFITILRDRDQEPRAVPAVRPAERPLPRP
jgi:putative RNA 2'-phosphotransferase